MGPQSTRWWFAGIFLVALALRLGYSLGLEEKAHWDDTVFLDQTARNWVAGEGLTQRPLHDTVADKEPVYPLILGVIYWVFGHGFLVPRVLQGVLGGLTAVLVAAIGVRLADTRVGLLGGSIVAVYPHFIFYGGMILSETLFTFWLVVLWWFFVRLPETSSGRFAAAAGIILGLAALTKASLMFFIPFAGLIAGVATPGSVRRKAAGGIVVAVMAILTIAPWTYRNYRMLDAFVPVRTGGGQFLYESNNPIADGGPWRGGKMELPGVAEAERLPEVERDRAYFRLATKFMLDNPGRMIELSLEKLRRFWNVVPNVRAARGERYDSPHIRFLSALTVTPLLILGCVGMVQAAWIPEARAWLFAYGLIFFYTALHTVFMGSIRYRDPLMPFVILFAAYGAVRLMRMAGRDRTA